MFFEMLEGFVVGAICSGLAVYAYFRQRQNIKKLEYPAPRASRSGSDARLIESQGEQVKVRTALEFLTDRTCKKREMKKIT